MEYITPAISYPVSAAAFPVETTVSSPIAWYVVALIVIVSIGLGLIAGMAAYCMWQGLTFSGQWYYAPNQPGYLVIGCF